MVLLPRKIVLMGLITIKSLFVVLTQAEDFYRKARRDVQLQGIESDALKTYYPWHDLKLLFAVIHGSIPLMVATTHILHQ